MQFFSKLTTLILVKVLVIVFALSLIYGHPVAPAQPESPRLIIVRTMDEALDISLAAGDYRRIDWNFIN